MNDADLRSVPWAMRSLLGFAFDLAWPQITLAQSPATEIQLEQLRQRLGNFIVACACRGEFEPEKLVQTALRAFIIRRAA